MSRNGNKPLIDTAMLLSAGFGTRLRPLTYVIPKPLLKVKGRPIIEYNLKLLKNAGIKNVVINLHHLGDLIEEYLGSGKRYGLKIIYTREKKILGTGGGIKNAEKYLKNGLFVVINSDVLADIDLKKVIEHHFEMGGFATIVVRKLKKGETYAKLNIAKDGQLIGFGKGEFMFTGIQVFNPVIFRFLKKPSCLIKSGYKQLLRHKLPVYVYEQKGYWNDIGTIQRLKSANQRGKTFKKR